MALGGLPLDQDGANSGDQTALESVDLQWEGKIWVQVQEDQAVSVEAMEMVVETSGGRALTMEALVMVVLDQTVVPLQAVLGDLMSRQTEEAYWEVHHLQETTKDQVVGWVKCLTLHRQSQTLPCLTGRYPL